MSDQPEIPDAIEAARLVWQRAQGETREAKREFDDFVAEAVRIAQARAEDLYREGINACEDVEARAKAVYEEKMVERAQAGLRTEEGLGVGDRVRKWRRVGSYRSGWVQTDTCGVIEVWTHEKDRAHASNPRPSVGHLYIRVLKKNGEPSLRVERMNRGFRSDRWFLPMDWKKA